MWFSSPAFFMNSNFFKQIGEPKKKKMSGAASYIQALEQQAGSFRTLQPDWNENEILKKHLDWTSRGRWSVGPGGRCILQICRAPHCKWLKTQTNHFYGDICSTVNTLLHSESTWSFLGQCEQKLFFFFYTHSTN